MPSLSKTVSLNGWMTLSPWVVYLGLVAICSPATAQLAVSAERDSSRTLEAQPFGSNSSLPQVAPETSPVIPPVMAQQPAPDQPIQLAPAAPANAVPADRPAEIAVSTADCLTACNPTERFLFNSPAIAIPPRSADPRPVIAQNPAPLPEPVAAPLAPAPPTVQPSQPSPNQTAQAAELQPAPSPRRPLTPPSLHLQGVYLFQADKGSARIRITGVYPILPELQLGGSLDFTDGNVFSESGDDGLAVNELYAAASLPNYPNLRLIVGQIDLTSYFDRNSFAKDAATQFFNPVFSTNPALSAAGLGSRQGAVVNWTITDDLEAKAAVFSSDRSISSFELNGFAGELGGRLGNLILRGTYVTGRDSGANTGFEEIFSQPRGNDSFGLRDGDREDGYGLNAEYFIPEIKLGLFARYGWYENRGLDQGATTYSVGANLLDLFMQGDRLGLGYGRLLSSNSLRDGNNPDVLEAFYDFRVLDFLRLGVTFQALNEFSETIAGFRIRTDFDLIPRRDNNGR